jgi:hypothetical protein
VLHFSCVEHHESRYISNPWYKYSENYIRHDKIIFENKIGSAQEGINHLHSRDDIKSKLLNEIGPSHSELNRLLLSSNSLDKQVALVNIMLRKIDDLELYRKIVVILQSDEDVLTRFYSYHCFHSLEKDKVKVFEDEIISVIAGEKVDGNIITAMNTLVKLDPPELVDMFTIYLSDGSPEVKQAAYINLDYINEKYRNEIMENINQRD